MMAAQLRILVGCWWLLALPFVRGADTSLTNIWPDRATPTKIEFVDIVGEAPKDWGAFGWARIVELPDDDPGNLNCLVVLRYARPRTNPQRVFVGHARGSVRLPMRKYNGSRASIRLSHSKQPKGTFVYLTGIVGLTPPEKKLVDTFQDAGWHTIVSETSHNFFRRRHVTVDMQKFNTQAAQLGTDVNDHLADKAYTVEALLSYLRKKHPTAVNGPLVIAGGSAGAIAVPAVATRVGRADAIVLIGSGGNASRIVTESSLAPITLYRPGTSSASIKPAWLSTDERNRFAAAMHEQVDLDGLRLAQNWHKTPILMVRAELDEMVPAATNDELYEALGKPERWSMPVNHIMLFAALHLQSGMIYQWTTKAIDRVKHR